MMQVEGGSGFLFSPTLDDNAFHFSSNFQIIVINQSLLFPDLIRPGGYNELIVSNRAKHTENYQ